MAQTLKTEKPLERSITPQAIKLSEHVRTLATSLRDKSEGTPLAAETRLLAEEAGLLCDYVAHVQANVDSLISKANPVAEQQKAKEIQKEIHQFNPKANDIIKALLMWRDSPKERVWKDEEKV